MRLKKWILMAASGVVLFSITGFVWEFESGIRPESTRVALRQAGHRLLLASGDSTSLVAPVKTIGKNRYEISFQNTLSIDPDKLVDLVDAALEESGLPKDHILEVINCRHEDIAYSYQMAMNLETSIIPCLGRSLPKDCYKLRIHFLGGNQLFASGNLYFGLISLSLIASLLAFVKSADEKRTTKISLGKYTFHPEENTLSISGKTLRLTSKESEILHIFCRRQNELISREELEKRIWLDKGVIVGRSLDVFISKLRKKLEEDQNIQLVNIHGSGYKLEVS